MRVAVFSDIHSTPKKLDRVLSDARGQGVDLKVCLGDIVGYGKDPETVIKLLISNKVYSIMGNHDMALFDDRYLDQFQNSIKKTIKHNRKKISEKSKHYLKSLKPFHIIEDLHFVHGAPPDSITTYLYDASDGFLKTFLSSTKSRLFFTGHTHKVEVVEFNGKDLIRGPILKPGVIKLNPRNKYIFNIGSVVLPRDRIQKSKYVVVDTEANTVNIRFV